jgi:hypothetical protein
MKSISWAMGKFIVDQMARDIISVQPMNIDMAALFDDPLANMLASNYVARAQGKDSPFPYKGTPK